MLLRVCGWGCHHLMWRSPILCRTTHHLTWRHRRRWSWRRRSSHLCPTTRWRLRRWWSWWSPAPSRLHHRHGLLTNRQARRRLTSVSRHTPRRHRCSGRHWRCTAGRTVTHTGVTAPATPTLNQVHKLVVAVGPTALETSTVLHKVPEKPLLGSILTLAN